MVDISTRKPVNSRMSKFRLLPIITLVLSLGVVAVSALELRTWTSTTGINLEAEFVRIDGEKVILKDKTGREVVVKRAQLSQGDLEYLKEFGPKAAAPALGEKPAKATEIPTPAKDAKIDQKTFKTLTERFVLPEVAFNQLQTPHFLVLYPDKVDASDFGETAERVWLDMAFFHPTFAQKFKDRSMALFLIESEYDFGKIIKWYAETVRQSGAQNALDAASSIEAVTKQAAAFSMSLPADIAEKYSVLDLAKVVRANPNGTKTKGVYVPFRVHCLAQQMMNVQAGGVSQFGSDGLFALNTGHAYFKEISITGRSESGLLRDDGTTRREVSSTGGFESGKNWPDELKKLLRRDKIKPDIEDLYKVTLRNAKMESNVLAYAFSRFLQSNTDRVALYAKLLEQIDTSKQIPAAADLAKLYGYQSTAGMQKAWIEWMLSGSFR